MSSGFLSKWLLLSLFMFILDINGYSQIDNEENDINDNCSPFVPFIPLEISNSAALHDNNDVDFFQIDIPDGGVLHVSVNAVLNAAFVIQVWSPNCQNIASATGGLSQAVALDAVVCEGNYFVRVSRQSGTAPIAYEVNASTDYNFDSWHECNNTFDTAKEVPADTSFAARLFGQNSQLAFTLLEGYGYQTDLDQDYFKIVTNESGLLEINITQVPSNLSLIISIYNSSQTLLNSRMADVNGSNVSSQTLLCGAGTFYIRIHEFFEFGGVGASPYENSPLPFQIQMSYETSSDNCECNNTFPTACFLPQIDTTFQNKLYGQNSQLTFTLIEGFSFQTSLDQDYFRVTPNESGLLEINITQAPSNLRLIISIYNSSQTLLNSRMADANGGNVSSQTLLCGAGTFYIRIHEHFEFGGGGASPYENSPLPFLIQMSYDTSDICECNNTFETACEKMVVDTFDFKINGINQLMHYTPNDRDFFKFCPEECGNVNFKVIGIPENFQLRTRLYTDTAEVNSPIQNIATTGLNNLEMNFDVEAGECYYLMLSHNNDTQTSSQAMTAQVSFTSYEVAASFIENISVATVVFTNTTLNADSYEWDFGDGNVISTDENPTHTYTESGTYEVTLTASGECGVDVFTLTINVNVVGVEGFDKINYSIYPNPSNGLFTIETDEQGTMQYTIYDGTGKLVLIGTTTSQRSSLDLSHLPDGTYLFKMNETTRVLSKVK